MWRNSMSSCTDERNAQILIQVLKAHGIKKVIASPGTTNACLVSSMQSDPFFEIYSAPEERSGAYMACGMAAESGEPVVLSCTGATASRNYMPALTEAFYRKLPILTVTSSRRNAYIGHNCDQVTDRTVLPNDVAKISVQMPIVLDDVSEWKRFQIGKRFRGCPFVGFNQNWRFRIYGTDHLGTVIVTAQIIPFGKTHLSGFVIEIVAIDSGAVFETVGDDAPDIQIGLIVGITVEHYKFATIREFISTIRCSECAAGVPPISWRCMQVDNDG